MLLRLALLMSLVCALSVGALGCRTPGGPEVTAESYARALRENRLEDAYALTCREHRRLTSFEEFRRKYADAGQRQARASAVQRAIPYLRAQANTELEAVRDPEGWRMLDVLPSLGPREALERFLTAAEAGDFAGAYRLLTSSWRARYTPQRLQADFAQEPLARERLQRARMALGAGPTLRGEVAEFPIGNGRAVRLLRERDGFKVAALE